MVDYGNNRGHDVLFDVGLLDLDEVHPHAAIRAHGVTNVDQTSLSLLDQVLNYFQFFNLLLGIV